MINLYFYLNLYYTFNISIFFFTFSGTYFMVRALKGLCPQCAHPLMASSSRIMLHGTNLKLLSWISQWVHYTVASTGSLQQLCDASSQYGFKNGIYATKN